MVQLTLPKNSRLVEGKVWPKSAGAKETTEFKVYRWKPDDGIDRASTLLMACRRLTRKKRKDDQPWLR